MAPAIISKKEAARISEKQVAFESAEEFSETIDIVVSRCSMCHAREPLWDGLVEAPGGILLETEHDIAINAKQIYVNAGISNYMPPNNISYMEPSERKLIVEWFETYY